MTILSKLERLGRFIEAVFYRLLPWITTTILNSSHLCLRSPDAVPLTVLDKSKGFASILSCGLMPSYTVGACDPICYAKRSFERVLNTFHLNQEFHLTTWLPFYITENPMGGVWRRSAAQEMQEEAKQTERVKICQSP